VLFGRNDRNFAAAKVIGPPGYGVLSSGTIFADGSRDLLIAGHGDCISNAGTPGVIYHILPNGAPSLRGTAPACISVLADLDGDGIADLVGNYRDELFVWKGLGTGQFLGPVTQIAISGIQTIQDWAFRDMDQDGHADIEIAGAILYGKGNLQFDTVQVTDTADQRFLVGDFDGDGISDIMVAGGGPSYGRSGVLFGTRGRGFNPITGSVPSCWAAYLQNPVVGDLNGDGMDDLVCGTTSANMLTLFVSAGRTGFVHDQTVNVHGFSNAVSSASVGDFNGDGRLDIAAGMFGTDDVVVFTNDGAGKYVVSSYAVGGTPIYSIVGDFNRDGAPDLAFFHYGLDFKPTTVSVLLHK
jgi:hypothetical protein